VKDQVLDFGHRGWLREESFLFYDYQTDSLWEQATGEAIHGAYKGTRLERLPATQTTWSVWRTQYPQTRVLSRSADKSVRYWRDRYDRYYETGNGVAYQRHAPLGFGLAVVLPGEQKLYPFRELEKKGILADRVAGEPVVIVLHRPSRTAAAFDPRHEGRVYEFGSAEVGATDVLVKDRQTGSTWSGLTGRCLDGAAKGTQLRQVTTTQFVVETWRLHYPKGAIYEAP
jgi:hypothetical protein